MKLKISSKDYEDISLDSMYIESFNLVCNSLLWLKLNKLEYDDIANGLKNTESLMLYACNTQFYAFIENLSQLDSSSPRYYESNCREFVFERTACYLKATGLEGVFHQ